MAEAEVQTDNGGDSSSTKTVVIIIVVVALAALGFYLLSNRSTEETDMGDVREEVAEEIEEGMEDVTAADLQKLRLFKTFAQQVEPILSDTGKENLQVVVVFVETNPESLEDQSGVPAEVMAAAEAVWTEVRDAWGNSVAVLQESIAVAPGEDAAVSIGDVVTLDGPFDLTDIESPLGPVFSVVSNANGQTYYLVFDETETERVMDFVGQEVTMQVEVTAMEEDGSGVGFTVVEGPDLAEEAVEEEVVEEVEETEETEAVE